MTCRVKCCQANSLPAIIDPSLFKSDKSFSKASSPCFSFLDGPTAQLSEAIDSTSSFLFPIATW